MMGLSLPKRLIEVLKGTIEGRVLQADNSRISACILYEKICKLPALK